MVLSLNPSPAIKSFAVSNSMLRKTARLRGYWAKQPCPASWMSYAQICSLARNFMRLLLPPKSSSSTGFFPGFFTRFYLYTWSLLKQRYSWKFMLYLSRISRLDRQMRELKEEMTSLSRQEEDHKKRKLDAVSLFRIVSLLKAITLALIKILSFISSIVVICYSCVD